MPLKRSNAAVNPGAGKLLQAVIDNMADAVVTIDATGRIVSFSRAAERMFGYGEDTVRGRNVSMLMAGPDQQNHDHYLRRFLETGISIILNQRGRELKAQRSDGSVFDVELTVGEIDGVPQRMFVGVLRDISERAQARELLAESEEKLRNMFELSSLGMARNTMDGRFLEANRALLDMLGYSLEELGRLTYWDVTPETFAPQEAQQLESLRLTGAYGPYIKQYIHRSGRRIDVQLSGNLITGSDGEKYIWSTIEDITERQANEEALRSSETRLNAVMRSLPVACSAIDREGNAILLRGRDLKERGLDPEVLVGKHMTETLRDMPDVLAAYERALAGEANTMIRWIDGQAVEMHFAPMTNSDGAIIGATNIAINVTEREQQAALMQRQALTDSVTGLANRNAFNTRLHDSLTALGRHRTSAVLLVDIDHFKRINATRGHSAGDELLAQISGRLAGLNRPHGLLARIGGDEFALLLADLPGDEADLIAADVARQVAEALRHDFRMTHGAVSLAASIGIAVAPRDGDTPELLLRRADTALHAAKEGGRDRTVFFEPEMDLRVQRLVAIDCELQHALARHEFRLAYQPVVDAAGRMVKVEALLRWRNPTLGELQPDTFVPIAEESGQIVAIGAWVLRQAAIDMAERERLGAAPLTVSVNVSARQIGDPNFPHHVRNALSAAGLPPERLELELTERLLIGETPQALSAIAELHAHGVRFAVDDFGVGYSSLSYLTRFPFKTIKIDRSFARDLQSNARHLEMYRAIVALGRSLEAQVVAEGVETAEIAQLLVGIGCTLQQGFVHGRPCPIGDIAAAAATSPFAGVES